MLKNILFYTLIIFSLQGSTYMKGQSINTTNKNSAPNILLIIADDMGKDPINGFAEGSIKANTPNIDNFRNKGITFNNVWSNPVCSSTRAALITGKYGFRTNVKGVGDILSITETSLQQYINEKSGNAYATAIVGKWHLSGNRAIFNPEIMGIDFYSGFIKGAVQDYYNWTLNEDGSSNQQNSYITEALTTTSINWIKNHTKPWFLWLAYNAPHKPFHVPPMNMHKQGELPAYEKGMNATPYYLAAIEAMDFQIGRLLNTIPVDERNNTLIIFIGDNGTPNNVAQSPYISTRVKSTLYQGGINVPMFISGKGVTRNEVDNNLINVTDLFSTIAEVAGVKTTKIHDSKSITPLFTRDTIIRNFQYAEIKNEYIDMWAISDGRYKLIVNANGAKQLFFLTTDPYESINLLDSNLTPEQSSAMLALETQLILIRQ